MTTRTLNHHTISMNMSQTKDGVAAMHKKSQDIARERSEATQPTSPNAAYPVANIGQHLNVTA